MNVCFSVIGIGSIFPYHIHAIRHVIPDAIICATDTDTSKAELAHGMDVTFVDDLYTALTASDIVIVCVPCAAHHAIAKHALSAGKTVLLEKPPTKTLNEFLDLIRTVKTVSGARLICAFHSAHGVEVVRFAEEMKDGSHPKYGKLVRFRSEFDDPYVKDGVIISNLGGSFEDSAPNALSVLAQVTDISQFSVVDALFCKTLPTADGLSCQESSGKVTFNFPAGHGTIRTNWTRGLNRKVTYLKFRDDVGKETWVCLHHSDESILIDSPSQSDDNIVLLADLREASVSRMDHHYHGVYQDFLKLIAGNKDNMLLGAAITTLWTSAYEEAGIKTA